MTESNEKRQGAVELARQWARRHYYAAAAGVTTLVMGTLAPELALADNAQGILSKITDLLKNGLMFVGGAMVVFGAVTIGINVHGSAQGNGGAIASGVAVLVGGAIVAAAAAYFGTLDVSWAG